VNTLRHGDRIDGPQHHVGVVSGIRWARDGNPFSYIVRWDTLKGLLVVYAPDCFSPPIGTGHAARLVDGGAVFEQASKGHPPSKGALKRTHTPALGHGTSARPAFSAVGPVPAAGVEGTDDEDEDGADDLDSGNGPGPSTKLGRQLGWTPATETAYQEAIGFPAPYIPPTKKDSSVSWGGRGCRHWQGPFMVTDGYVVALSASMDRPMKNAPPPTDCGVYLATSWIPRTALLWTNGSMGRQAAPGQEILAVDWPDRGVIPLEDLDRAIRWAWTRMVEGRSVDVGCQGGHGRTGTFAGALLVFTGMDTTAAIKAVRTRHCSHAIETKGQEALLHGYARLLEARKGGESGD